MLGEISTICEPSERELSAKPHVYPKLAGGLLCAAIFVFVVSSKSAPSGNDCAEFVFLYELFALGKKAITDLSVDLYQTNARSVDDGRCDLRFSKMD